MISDNRGSTVLNIEFERDSKLAARSISHFHEGVQRGWVEDVEEDEGFAFLELSDDAGRCD